MKFVKTIKVILAALLVAAAFQSLTAKKGSARGTYVFDNKSAMAMFKQEMKGQKVPKEMEGFVEIIMAMFKDMKFELKLRKGGKLEANIQMPAFDGGKATSEKNQGTWKQKGDKVTLTMKEKDPTGKMVDKDLNCEKKKKKLVCADGQKKLVFRKVK